MIDWRAYADNASHPTVTGCFGVGDGRTDVCVGVSSPGEEGT